MSANVQVLNHGTRVALPAVRAEDGLVMLVGGGRGAALRIDGPVAGVWLPLRGRLQLSAGDSESVHHRGEARVVCADAGIQAVGRGHALWLALAGAPTVWRDALAAGPMRDSGLLPAAHEVDHAVLHRALVLARAVLNGERDVALAGMVDEIGAMQSRFDEMIARCPGRTWAQRRHVFLRLQRVREHLACNCHLDLDNAALARIASYSPWHFIRAFHAAYRETPHAFLVAQRLQRAQRLLRSSPLAIGEIALACGFENRCAFARLFRQRFGTTASALRRQAAQSPLRSASHH
ncbi:MAG: helix-turn-helix transcriptional regulator [Rudaea sp.]|uniref:AraC family transcriptional regulator n=1 Tax=unclassified Rudaea TaxID=2627037 RepID=UPI0010F8AD48|nr:MULTISPECIES: helix-turn-helix transcriptional regulator [unclassified Rudaea]MBN8886524.1 helix-turn-helix transcriptional regulator [Rudaea sp.]